MDSWGPGRTGKSALLAIGFLASCGDEFSTRATGDGGSGETGGTGTGGSKSTGGTGTGGRLGAGGRIGSGGVPSSGGFLGSGGRTAAGGAFASGGRASSGGNVGSGGTVASGGAPTMASGGANASGGTPGSGGSGGCSPLTLLTFADGDFESSDPVDVPPGWEGAPNPPYYSALSTAAARTGTSGVEFNDTGSSVPGIQQKIPVPAEALGKTVTVTAWFRLVTFPSMRLLVEANLATGVHAATPFQDTDPATPGFQQLSVSLTIPPATDHLMVKLISGVANAEGIAHADDVRVCVDGRCSPCTVP